MLLTGLLMDIAIKWNVDTVDEANRKLIEKDLRSEIEDTCRMMEINADELIAAVNQDPFFSTLIGAVQANGELVMTFTYSLMSGHKATYQKVT